MLAAGLEDAQTPDEAEVVEVSAANDLQEARSLEAAEDGEVPGKVVQDDREVPVLVRRPAANTNPALAGPTIAQLG